MLENADENADKYFCENCDFKCSKKSNFDKHLLTLKHNNVSEKMPENAENAENAENKSTCVCGKFFKHPSSLSRHKINCKELKLLMNKKNKLYITEKVENEMTEIKTITTIMIDFMKSNTELQKQMLEVCKNGNTTINSNNNSHNKTFNMQFFLNEQCKDAMNITDFIDSFQLQFADLERVGELGYVEGISDIIIKKLNEMDIYKRPIHCSDTKRDIMYVRAENVWEKETNGHDRLRLFIKQITHKNIKLIPLWAAIHPQAKDHQHPLNDNYLGMVSQAMGGRGDLEESENKIIKRIAKTVYIDKH
jgi:hypothetical protein